MRYILEISAIFLLVSCYQQSNSNTADQSIGVEIDASEGARFQQAFQVLNAECIQCHTSRHQDWGRLIRESDWVSDGLVVAGDSNNSWIVKRIHSCGNTDEGAQMPIGDLLTKEECDAITNWINNIAQ